MKSFYAIVVSLVLASALFAPTFVGAQNPILQGGEPLQGLGSRGPVSLTECIKDGRCGAQHIEVLANNIIKWMVAVAGAVALLMYVIGGMWMLFSTGNQTRIERGKDIIIGTSTALIFILASWIIVSFTLSAIGTKERFQLTPAACGSQKDCRIGEQCVKNRCISLCEANKGNESNPWSCQAPEACGVPSWDVCGTGSYQNCEKNLCPGGRDTVCCYNPK